VNGPYKEYFCKPMAWDQSLDDAHGLWKRYDAETDAWDLAHGARINDKGEVGPAHPSYQGASNRFAAEALRRLVAAATARGISEAALRRAKNHPDRHRL
jgi:hypothetical protein